MIVFYDPTNGKQVMAVYSHDTKSTAWKDRGFLRAEVVDPALQRLVNRDSTVDVLDGVVTQVSPRLNDVQGVISPAESRLAELREKVKNDTDTPDEFREYIKLKDNL